MRLVLLLCLASLPALVFADGKVFPQTAIRESVAIPDQQALIHWSEGTERLVIQTSFIGSGTNFAWVVPLPAKPVIENVSSGLFPTLNYLFEPELVHRPTPWYRSVIFGVGLLGLLLEVKRGQRLGIKGLLSLVIVCASVIASSPLAGMFVSVLLTAGVFLVCMDRTSAITLLLLTLIGMLGAILLPSLGGSRAAGMSEESRMVDILERNRVGAYETVTLSAREPAELAGWLGENGFQISSNAMPALADYTRRGWVFVAAKLARSGLAGKAQSIIHPLSFTFKSSEAVYPMRLTGVDGRTLEVKLYVFGPGTASAQGFAVRHSGKPEFQEPPKEWVRTKPKSLQIHHPALRNWVKGSAVATSLQGTLSTAQQDKDIVIDWTPFRHKVTREFSHAAAITHSANIASVVLLAGIAVFGVSRVCALRLPWFSIWLLVAVVAVTGLGIYLSVDKVNVKFAREFNYHNNLRMLGMSVRVADTIGEMREEIAFQTNSMAKYLANPLVGGLIREEESPGNYALYETEAGLEFVGYDAAGAPHVLDFAPRDYGTNEVTAK